MIELEKKWKVAVIGAGSYVFSMGLLYDLIVKNKLENVHLVLMDINEPVAEMMKNIGERMAEDSGLEILIDATNDRTLALKDADFVTSSVAIQLHKRYEMDKSVLDKYGIKEVSSECGGLGGLSYALRSIPLVLEIAKDMEKYCPDAWLFNVSNPLPRVLTAINKYTSIKTAGFCNVANGGEDGYENIEKLIGKSRRRLSVISGGINHFSWLLSVTDKEINEDLLPLVHSKIIEGAWDNRPFTKKCFNKYGSLLLPGDSHVGEFFPFDEETSVVHYAHHGNDKEREERQKLMREVSVGTKPWELLMEGRSWEKPGDVISAMVKGESLELDMVNIPNEGYIDNLPDEAIVEVPASVQGRRIIGTRIGKLPEEVSELCSSVSKVISLTAEAAVSGNMAIIQEIIQVDPAIPEKEKALLAVQELIAVHSDLLPLFQLNK